MHSDPCGESGSAALLTAVCQYLAYQEQKHTHSHTVGGREWGWDASMSLWYVENLTSASWEPIHTASTDSSLCFTEWTTLTIVITITPTSTSPLILFFSTVWSLGPRRRATCTVKPSSRGPQLARDPEITGFRYRRNRRRTLTQQLVHYSHPKSQSESQNL